MMNWRRYFRRTSVDDEVARDLQFYLDSETEDNLARGMSAGEARAAAIRKLGNPTSIREEVYRMNTACALETIWLDLRYAYRVLRMNSAFTAMAILSLALGIGGNTAVFTAVRGVLLKPLPYRDPGRLVKVAEADPDTPDPETVDFTTTSDWRTRSRSFDSLSLYRNAAGAIVENGRPELLEGMRVSYDYFDTLGVRMHLGRAFLPEEDRPDSRYQVILTHSLWMRRFGGDPRALGRTIRMTDNSFTIVGVLPAGFRPLARVDDLILPEFYSPLGYALGQPSACRGCQHLQLIGRLKAVVSVEQARQELGSIMREIVREHSADYAQNAGVRITPLREHMVGRVTTTMWVLFGAVGLVLLMACANVANLVLARVTGRAKEMALRAALGAGRRRLVRQLMLECLLLGAASGFAGLLLASLATSALAAYGSRQLPRISEIGMDPPVLWFTVGVSLITVAMFGVMPALGASRVDLTTSLKDTGRATDGRTRLALRRLLVTAELALAFVLVIGAGLLGESFMRLTGVDPGYDPRNVLSFGVYAYGQRYQKPEAELNLYRQVEDRLLAMPGVESVGMTSVLPMDSFDRRALHIQERPLANPADAPSADTYSVSTDYFRVMRIPLKRGRTFTGADRLGTVPVALISESCARAQFAGTDPIGKHIQLGGLGRDWLTIVGVVGDVRQYGLDRPSNMEAYLAQAQDLNFGYNMLIRSTVAPQRMENAVRGAFLAVDPTQPVYHVRPLADYLSDSLAARTFTLALLGLFGALAVVLAAIGIYGVISYAVSARTREMGIRMALGAGRREVLWMMLLQGMGLSAVGIAWGLGASLALARFLSTLLYEVRPTDPLMYAMTALGIAALAFLATLVPSIRATRIDPMTALRVG